MIKPQQDPKTGLWHARPSIGGKRVRITARTKGQFLDLYHEAKAQHQKQKLGLVDPAASLDPTITVGALIDRYLDVYPERQQSKTALEDRLKHARRTFGDALILDLSRETIQRWVNNLTAINDPKHRPLKPTSKRYVLKALRQVLKWGVDEGIIRHNPAVGVKAPKSDGDAAQPFASWDEVRAVADAIGDRHRPLVLFWAATGLRPEEIVAVRWSDIQLGDRPTLTVNRTLQAGQIIDNAAKNDGSLRTIRLTPFAVEVLSSLPQPLNSSQLVFPGARGGVIDLPAFRRGPWKKALDTTGLAYRPPKHLRHTFATLALSGGTRIEVVSKMLGHKDVSITATYYARWTPTGDDLAVSELSASMPDSLRPKPSTDEESEAEAR